MSSPTPRGIDAQKPPTEAARLARLRSLVAEGHYDVDRTALASAVLDRIGPLLLTRELPPRPGRAHPV